MRLLLFSDLHLESAFARLQPQVVAQTRRAALRECLRRIVTLASELRVDAVCCGGDLFEQDRHAPDTAAFLRATFAGLDPMPVFIAPGNHDWLAPDSLYRRTRWSPNVHVFGEERLTPAPLADGLTLWGAGHHSPTNARGFLDGFAVDRGGVHLALFHGSEQGAVAIREIEQVRHAPFRAEQIRQAGLHHALLGHFHTPRDAPDHTYPGNPEPLTFGETGERGVVGLTVDGAGEVSRERHRVAVTEVHDVAVSLDGVTHAEEIQDRVEEALAPVRGTVRVLLRGEVDPEVDVDPSRLTQPAHVDAWLVVADEVRYAYDFDSLRQEQTVRGEFVREVSADDALD
jgi:DNA repair exonuclease SbcCD nuclease subunit